MDERFVRLVSLACHDLRTPLATIHGFARTLVRRDDLGDPTTRYVEMIEAASAQMAELLDSLALAARIEDERYEPALQEVDTATLARKAAARLDPDRVTAAGDGLAVRVDSEATERALARLAECALRHGGLEHVDITARGSRLEIAPIPGEVVPIILGDELRDLGAAIARRVIEALGGSIAVEDERLVVRLRDA
jgi:signal transduction histidine kinase